MKSKLTLFSFLALIFGTSIYLLFRTSSLKVFSWISVLNIDFVNSDIRKFTLEYSANLPNWFLFSLPDGLWTFSYVTMMLNLWNLKINYQSISWILLLPIIAIFSEIFQFIGCISGTFDFYDLIFYILGTFSPLLFYNKKIKIRFI